MRKYLYRTACTILIIALVLSGCGKENINTPESNDALQSSNVEDTDINSVIVSNAEKEESSEKQLDVENYSESEVESANDEAANTEATEAKTIISTENIIETDSADNNTSEKESETNDTALIESSDLLDTKESETEPESTTTKNPPAKNESTIEKKSYGTSNTANDSNRSTELNSTQWNAVAMLNCLCAISQEMQTSSGNKLYLEEVYNSLYNNFNLENIDEETSDHISGLAQNIENLITISTKRERLEYIYNQDKANSINRIVPNPFNILTLSNSKDWKDLVTTIAFTAVDSYKNYKDANNTLDRQYLLDGWELDDDAKKTISIDNDRTFRYRSKIVKKYKVPDIYSINTNDFKQFAENKNESNLDVRLQFLESHEKTYEAYGYYWLELASAYYEAGEYRKCLACISEYDKRYTDIFRKDIEYARVMPKAIVAAQNKYKNNKSKYISEIERFTTAIVENTPDSEWALKYFAAQSYLDLYSKSKNKRYLEEAYKIALNNVSLLSKEQKKLNAEYTNDIEEIEVPPLDLLADSKQKDQRKMALEYNNALKEKRKIELPPVYQPLILNCDLLFALAKKLNIDSKNKDRIEGILETSSSGVFASPQLNNKYSFKKKNINSNISFNTDELIVPAELFFNSTDDDNDHSANVTVVIRKPNGYVAKYDDWKITNVERTGKTISSFKVHLKNDKIKFADWSSDAKVYVIISNDNVDDVIEEYEVSKYVDNLPMIPDTVEFTKK